MKEEKNENIALADTQPVEVTGDDTSSPVDSEIIISENNPLSEEEKQNNLVKKYRFIQEKIIVNYEKGCKILRIAKIVATVLFLLFTLVAIIISSRNGAKLWWLVAWVIMIFANIAIFIPAEYAKYLVSSKVIPYLNDDNRLEFGEYDIFAEDDDEDEEE